MGTSIQKGFELDSEKVQELWNRGRTAWPHLEVERQTFIDLLSSKLDTPGRLETIDIGEVYIAAGCADGSSKAIATFEAVYFPHLFDKLKRMRLSPRQREEVVQIMREKLFAAAPGNYPKICDYAGQGRLPGLVRITAYRTAITLMRKAAKIVPVEDDALEIPAVADDPGLVSMRNQFREAFREAFAHAVSQLTSRERNVLRMRFLKRLTIEQIANVYGAHRASVFRWLSSAKDSLLRDTRAQLGRSLELDGRNVESYFKLLDSQLNISIEAMLQSGRFPQSDD